MNAKTIVRQLLEAKHPKFGEESEDDLSPDEVKALVKFPKSIEVHGRRWFNRTFGNTYHTARVYVDGEAVAHLGPAYGYDDGYLQTAMDWLIKNHYMPPDTRGGSPLWYYCEQNGIKFTKSVQDVKRQRDL